MADALVSAPVAIGAGVVAIGLLAVAAGKVSKETTRTDLVPMMGVLGAFVFAAQMINFSIPGTGSSGHIIGGILLAALLGPWAAYITLASVLIIQCLIFADGGIMALGCNLINMGAMSCLVAYPLIYKPIAGNSTKTWRIMTGATLASIVGLELGALLVTAETEMSGITALPTDMFLSFMLPIHLAIGACEGIATGLVLSFVSAYQPSLLSTSVRRSQSRALSKRTKVVMWSFGVVALLFAIGFTVLASSNPDGLEWSIAKVAGSPEIGPSITPVTAFMPDYDSTLSGIVGGLITLVTVWALCAILFRGRRRLAKAAVPADDKDSSR